MSSHRAGPRRDLLGQIDTSRLLLYAVTIFAGVASAGVAFVVSQIQAQIDKVGDQVDSVPEQLDRATAGLQDGLDNAGRRLDRKAADRQADLDRLTAALRALQGQPEEPVPLRGKRPQTPRAGPASPTPGPAATAATSAPEDPAAALCEALQLQCDPEKETP